ncbi:MAG TPA: UDP-N-acetylmuramoyl-L-alanine--D-glutamate ligase [Ignavibacteria bacterium]|nr:UDP-N-acetylmuramoyl-L-alanine--D-glutamate ligase [Ignavibacteria bacterium]
MTLDEIQNSSFTILGAGRSGIGIAKLLKKSGARVFLSDANPEDKLSYLDTRILDKDGIEFELGGHSERIYESDVFIKSPGIPPDSEVTIEAQKRGKKVVSEIEAGYWFCEAPIIAITGTNGKTTTTVLTGEVFKNAGMDVKVCGNVGLAFSEIIPEVTKESVVVLEVSSFQLDSIEDFKPKAAVFLNFKDDHLDWHKTTENYMTAKMKITMNQDVSDVFIYNHDDDEIVNKSGNVRAKKASFGMNKDNVNTGCFIKDKEIIYYKDQMNESIINIDEVFIKGLHNLYNSMAGILIAKEFGISNEVIAGTLRNFKGVEHRIEFVRELNGVKYYNDSKATNVESTKMALMSFDNIVLIMGGYGTADIKGIRGLIDERVKKIIAVGDSKDLIKEQFGEMVTKVNTYEEAVNTASKDAGQGDVVLLSPAYKSYDMFNNFEERGNEFKRIVNSLI